MLKFLSESIHVWGENFHNLSEKEKFSIIIEPLFFLSIIMKESNVSHNPTKLNAKIFFLFIQM